MQLVAERLDDKFSSIIIGWSLFSHWSFFDFFTLNGFLRINSLDKLGLFRAPLINFILSNEVFWKVSFHIWWILRPICEYRFSKVKWKNHCIAFFLFVAIIFLLLMDRCWLEFYCNQIFEQDELHVDVLEYLFDRSVCFPFPSPSPPPSGTETKFELIRRIGNKRLTDAKNSLGISNESGISWSQFSWVWRGNSMQNRCWKIIWRCQTQH